MSNKDALELNHILSTSKNKSANVIRSKKKFPIKSLDDWDDDDYDDDENKKDAKAFVQWSSPDGKKFFPAARTKKKLIPGVYEVRTGQSTGLYLEKILVKTEGLLRFSETESDKVVDEITKFWEKGDVFQEHGLSYKRGILLWGPPGSGKSCTLQIIMADVIARGGVVIKFDDPYLFIDGMRVVRTIQENTPIVVIMEDIDSIIKVHSESEVLNILDGVNDVQKVVFLATTNYPGELGGRIINRPSRFDKRFKIGFPKAISRKMYLESIIGKSDLAAFNIDIDKWVADTKKFSIAHLKELFIAVVILGDKYEDAIVTLQNMKEEIVDKDKEQMVGFHTSSDDEDD